MVGIVSFPARGRGVNDSAREAQHGRGGPDPGRQDGAGGRGIIDSARQDGSGGSGATDFGRQDRTHSWFPPRRFHSVPVAR